MQLGALPLAASGSPGPWSYLGTPNGPEWVPFTTCGQAQFTEQGTSGSMQYCKRLKGFARRSKVYRDGGWRSSSLRPDLEDQVNHRFGPFESLPDTHTLL